MKLYTEEQVEKLIKDTLNATTEGVFEWIKNETDIVDTNTRQVLNNAELDIKPSYRKSLLTEYIYKRLENYGIKFTQNK